MKKNNKISQKDVEHVAKLARIQINSQEKEKYSQQLSSIIGYVEKLNEIDTENIEPTIYITGLKNVMRADESSGCNVQDELIEAAPESERDMIKVKAVLKGGKQ